MKIKIVTAILDENGEPVDNEPESVMTRDYGNLESRKWLDRHLVWAVNNGRGVVITPNQE